MEALVEAELEQARPPLVELEAQEEQEEQEEVSYSSTQRYSITRGQLHQMETQELQEALEEPE